MYCLATETHSVLPWANSYTYVAQREICLPLVAFGSLNDLFTYLLETLAFTLVSLLLSIFKGQLCWNVLTRQL